MSIHPIRATIATALEEINVIERLERTLLEDFEEGRGDIPLADLGLDSLERMELLAALELEHGAVIEPQVFSQFSSLGGIASHVESAAASPGQSSVSPEVASEGSEPDRKTELPATSSVALFQRAFRGCRAVAELHQLLQTLEHRLTPLEFTSLRDWHHRGVLLPSDAAKKYEDALTSWQAGIERKMRGSGKLQPELFTSRRMAPAALHFRGPGESSSKTLLICFSVRGSRRLWIPHPVLLQHIDASRYDLLVLADPWRTAFRSGVPGMGESVHDVVRWIAKLELLGEYNRLRVLGCSAGGYPALLAGRLLGAELTACVAGRFPSERHLGEMIGMMFSSWISARRYRVGRVLLAYNETKNRDRRFARRIAWLTGANRLGVRLPGRDVGHDVMSPLVESGELGHFLERTLFSPLDTEELVGKRKTSSLCLPLD